MSGPPGRFEREARAAARLSHPAIVTLYEAAVDDEGAYLVSELVRGETLDTLLAHGQLSDRDVIGIALALCDALQHAHDQGVVHRDVKPSNVLVPEAPSTSAQVAKLTDFGASILFFWPATCHSVTFLRSSCKAEATTAILQTGKSSSCLPTGHCAWFRERLRGQ